MTEIKRPNTTSEIRSPLLRADDARRLAGLPPLPADTRIKLADARRAAARDGKPTA